jgi:xylan 1,4-beta-xylosidase
MFSQMGGQRVAVESSGAVPLDRILKVGVRTLPDVAALASLEGRQLSILAWHYHDDDVPGPDAAVHLELAGLPADARNPRLRH